MWYSKYLSRGTNVEVFKRMVLPVLFYGCETWTLTNDLNHRLDSLGTSSLRRILGYRWTDFMSNDRLLEETSMKNISELIFERQMSMFGHVARISSDDPAHRILSCGNPVGWKRGRRRPLSTWLRQMEEGYDQPKVSLGFRQGGRTDLRDSWWGASSFK